MTDQPTLQQNPPPTDRDAARLLLARMGLSAEDLLTTPEDLPPVPTFAEYIPIVSAAVTDGTVVGYFSIRKRDGET